MSLCTAALFLEHYAIFVVSFCSTIDIVNSHARSFFEFCTSKRAMSDSFHSFLLFVVTDVNVDAFSIP